MSLCRKNKLIIPSILGIILVMSLTCNLITTSATTIMPSMPEGPELAAAAWILIDPVSGRSLAEYEADARRSPASTTKILTALVALEHATSDKMMTASTESINSVGGDYVRAGIKSGETMSLRNLLELMLITSANEAGYIIAENISPDGTFTGFYQLMNDKALELGIPEGEFHFSNPCGIESEDHYCSARGLAIIAREAMKNKEFREIVTMTTIVAPDTNLRKSNEWQIGHLLSTNELVSNPSVYGSKYFLATGIKTGYTDLAGRCLVSSGINPDGLEFIAVVLGADTSEISFRESRRLLDFGFTTYAMEDLKLSGEYFGRFDVIDAADNTQVTINTLGSLSWLMPVDPILSEAITTEQAMLPETYLAPIHKGQILGELQIAVHNMTIGAIQLVADNDVEKSTWADIRDKYLSFLQNPKLLSAIKTIFVLFVLLMMLRFTLKAISRRKNKRKFTASRKNNYRIDHFRK